jgi:hypothetical protein
LSEAHPPRENMRLVSRPTVSPAFISTSLLRLLDRY